MQAFPCYWRPGTANEKLEALQKTGPRGFKPDSATTEAENWHHILKLLIKNFALFSGRLRIPVLRKLRELLLQVLDVARDLPSLIVGRRRPGTVQDAVAKTQEGLSSSRVRASVAGDETERY